MLVICDLALFFLTTCVCKMRVVFVFQTLMGSVDPSDADLRVRLAASYGRADGGLCRTVGSSFAPVDTGSPVGAADLTQITARGKSHTLIKRNIFDLLPLFMSEKLFTICYTDLMPPSVSKAVLSHVNLSLCSLFNR